MTHQDTVATSLREQIAHWIAHLAHVLPSQAPIRDFVHHNTLHGYQHLPFDEALATARRELGIGGYWPLERFRSEYAQGRITAADLDSVLASAHPAIDDIIVGDVSRRAIWSAVLRVDCTPQSDARVRWSVTEGTALRVLPPALGRESRRWRHGASAAELTALWHQVSALAPPNEAPPDPETAWPRLVAELGAKGKGTLRELILQLSGEDILDTIRADLIRHCATHLDQALAAWHHPDRQAGFYAAWRQLAAKDPSWSLGNQDTAKRHIDALPDDPVAVIEGELTRLGLPQAAWEGYIERLTIQLPGWSGMFLWRHTHPAYGGLDTPIDMVDYLAVRLVLENLAATAVTRRVWGVPASLQALASYFWLHPVELRLRLACHRGELPEALASRIQQMEAPGERAAQSRAAWDALDQEAAAIHTALETAPPRMAWPLFQLTLGLDMDAEALGRLGANGAAALLACAAELDTDQASYLWLQAYERHYGDEILGALAANHRRALPAAQRSAEIQLVLCMDDREEGYRRHLEEANPRLETLGAAAHFGVFQNWRGFGDATPTPLCPVVPVVITPAHNVSELPRDAAKEAAERWLQVRRTRSSRIARMLQRTRLGLATGLLGGLAGAPVAFAELLARSLVPRHWGQRREGAPLPPTRLAFTADRDNANVPATPEKPRDGFSDDEQAERIGNFLVGMGLTHDFAPLVVIMGHGSNSQNNPHLSAYDCGACSGRHSGPNARLFANMANRPEVRLRLAARGIDVPERTRFLGAEHNTCDDRVTWYDIEDIPEWHQAAFRRLRVDCDTASAAHALERCRRLMSAPLGMTPARAWQHVIGRRHDFAQPRPELGHVTNACAIIGRRHLSRGAFFDRRAFLISYDPTRDADGAVLTRHLTINGPVGAGINLEYYFSTVNNERYGCGSKTMHNVAGGLGVMSGAGGDLRTGLPRQMIEIHEPMRLLVIVEQSLELLTRIYQAQPAVQELVGNGWLLLAAIEPVETASDNALIHRFDPARGWQRWQAATSIAVAEVERSADWFSGHRSPLPPALLRRPLPAGAADPC